MRRPTRTSARIPRGQVTQSHTYSAPVGGWNARDALAKMKPTDAVILDNMIPGTSDVYVRPGSSNHVTGLPDYVESLMVYNGLTDSMWAACLGSIYDVTTAGAVGAATVTGLTNNRWQYVNFSTAGGFYLLAVNGTDTGRIYDGSTWAVDSITGVASADLIQINVWKRRIFLVQKNTMKVWYLGTNSISGAATSIDFGPLFKRGGTIQATATWTLDAGEGVDDYFVIITTKGEIAVYNGTDPATANTFALKGVWDVGAPIGRRCFLKWGGDLILICVDGVLPLSKALISSRLDPKVALTDKIQGAMSDAAALYPDNFGWEVFFYPKGDTLLLNVPVVQNMEQQQYAMNAITGEWGRFKDINANCWALFQDDAYFGGNRVVGKYDDTRYDNGTDIEFECLTAFSNFGSPGRVKRFTMAKPMMAVTGTPTLQGGINIDFSKKAPTSDLTFASLAAAIWGTSKWGIGLWGSGLSVVSTWQGCTGIGEYGAYHLKGDNSGKDIHFQAITYSYEVGGVM